MDNPGLMRYFLFFLVPFILSLGFTPWVRAIAVKKGLVSYPRADRWHKHPTAILGGIGIYLAAIIASLVFGVIGRETLGLFIGATLLFAVGLVDDKFHIAPYTKLFFQIVAACIAIFFGISFGFSNNILLVIPLTLLWIVGLTNSFNLLDNIDGLAAGIAVISSAMLFASSLILANNSVFGTFALILSGATLGFLPYNFNPAKIFMGDSGSMFLGYSLAIISISGTARQVSNLLATILIPVFILSVPIFDTVFVMLIRKIKGRAIFEGGTDHTSHQLVALGLSPRKTVLVLYVISIAFGLIAISYSRLDAFIISIIAFLAIVILLFFGVFLSEIVSYNAQDSGAQQKWQELKNKTVLNNIFLYKRRIAEVLLDLASICCAYYAAYFLRFEGFISPANMRLIHNSLAWLILIKISVFYLSGLYRGVWRYISISDLLTIFKAVSIASAACILFITFVFRFKDFSRALFFIDWLLLLFLTAGYRVLFRVMAELFSRAGKTGKNIAIFGAGDAGEMAVREIKRNRNLHYNPVGFIDDNPYKVGSKIHGLPVLGARDDIKELVRQYDIKEIIIAISSISADGIKEISEICQAAGVSYRKIKGILDGEKAGTDE